MTGWILKGATLAALCMAGTVHAESPDFARDVFRRSASASTPTGYLECVPYARQVSGIALYGDAHTWWDQAKGRFIRGRQPRPGAVMSFRPHGAMELGHVAAVTRVIDSRTVLLRHANWSPIAGRRGQIENGVRAVDVSAANDWSEVRVWYAPLGQLGNTHWPVDGFIYNEAPGPERRLALAPAARAQDAAPAKPRPTRLSRIDNDFLAGIAADGAPPARRPTSTTAPSRQLARNAAQDPAPVTARAAPRTASATMRDDPIGRIIASRMP